MTLTHRSVGRARCASQDRDVAVQAVRVRENLADYVRARSLRYAGAMRRSVLFLGVLAPVLSAALVGCPDPEEQPPLPRVDGGVDATSDVQPPAPKSWHTVASNLPEALLSVSGTSSSDASRQQDLISALVQLVSSGRACFASSP